MTENELFLLCEKTVKKLIEKNITVSVAESCTGGLLSKLITDVSGCSSIYPGGVCTYSNTIKTKLLGVKEDTLSSFGAVSENTAAEMAEGVKKLMNTDIGIGITGIAGPGSDNTNKPAGLIYIAIKSNNTQKTVMLNNSFTEDIRTQNRYSAVFSALTLLSEEADL